MRTPSPCPWAGSTLVLLLAACSSTDSDSPGADADRSHATRVDAADVIIVGGTVVTMDARMPRVDAIALRDGKIQALGPRAKIEALAGDRTRRIDVAGGTCTPGLQDAHAHLVGLGRHLEEIDLRGAQSIEDVIQRIRARAPASGWITGRGWDQNLWPGAAMPTHDPLTQAFPDRPVWLRRVDGHAGWANRKALEAGAITAQTPDPTGGELLRNEAGEPTGVLVDTAMALVPVPAPSAEAIERWILAGQTHALARGLTAVHDMGVSADADAIYRRLATSTDDAARLRLRVVGYADVDWFEQDILGTREPEVPAPEAMYSLAGVKAYADGALGSRGAALLAPYSDRPDHRGKLIRGLEPMEKLATEAMGAGWQVATHAIGDHGNRMVLDAYERAFQRHRTRDHRFRIEHAQIVDPADIARFARLSVIASMQPTHATSDMAWVPDRIGDERLTGAYAWRRFLKTGVHLAFGSDFPVEQVEVTHGLYAAITRTDPTGRPEGGWLADQILTLDEAVHAFTVEAAYASRREQHLGHLAEGMQADLTCFAQDIWTLAPAQLRSAPILATIVGGEIAYEAP